MRIKTDFIKFIILITINFHGHNLILKWITIIKKNSFKNSAEGRKIIQNFSFTIRSKLVAPLFDQVDKPINLFVTTIFVASTFYLNQSTFK